jgi:hypothetical protein
MIPIQTSRCEAASSLQATAIDRTDGKQHVLPPLFFKRAGEVFGKETAAGTTPVATVAGFLRQDPAVESY